MGGESTDEPEAASQILGGCIYVAVEIPTALQNYFNKRLIDYEQVQMIHPSDHINMASYFYHRINRHAPASPSFTIRPTATAAPVPVQVPAIDATGFAVVAAPAWAKSMSRECSFSLSASLSW